MWQNFDKPTQQNTLLRAAENVTQTPTEELLRSASESQHEPSSPRPENTRQLAPHRWWRRK